VYHGSSSSIHPDIVDAGHRRARRHCSEEIIAECVRQTTLTSDDVARSARGHYKVPRARHRVPMTVRKVQRYLMVEVIDMLGQDVRERRLQRPPVELRSMWPYTGPSNAKRLG
jgi:hypothetical protein